MRQLEDTIEIETPPERIWSWLEGLVDHYQDWHSGHISAAWDEGEPNQVGSILRAVEVVGGRHEELCFELTSIDPPHRFDYRLLGPVSLVMPQGSFSIEPNNGGATFRATLAYRGGPVTAWLFRNRLDEIQAHMQEEGENLKQIMEE